MNGPYSEKVMDHFMEPRNMGDIKDADAVGTVGNPACGDVMRLYLKVEGNKIVEAKFKTFGCGAAIATSSMSTEMIVGKTLEEALEVTNEAVAEALDGLPPNKMHCSVLAQEAIEAAIKDYKEKK
ncbi:MAG: Fe-S cluster assembly scaffold protein NifU [Candidatus Scalindua sp.]|nr:Fe-S cluster assembly scaffold protein NifU [Candidatus Scalindua sp.]MDV5165507.1 Fe-S cluster assembly scaffold protein NifU [Candidatus Scalindua sp.]